ncbi:MAG: EAL domain-containing protein [Bacillota bacterium]|nr:EAL domain-containing protein [Bacillota bacterium]
MTSISIIELLDYIRKHVKLIIVSLLVCAVASQFVMFRQQRYTATVSIKYTFDDADKGKNPKGGKLDAYEIMSPIVIEKAISALSLNTSVERIRNSITVTPFIDDTTQEKQKALTEKGEDFTYYPTEYAISFSHSGRLGAQYGKIFLNKLLESYDDYFRQTYTGQRKIQDAFTSTNYGNYDYMEICEFFEGQFDEIQKTLNDLNKENSTFRSPKTGLTFSDLNYYFSNLRTTDYDKLYANVRMGHLSKDKELLIKKYKYRIEDLELNSNKKQEEANTAYKILQDFYKQYNNNGSSASQNNKVGSQQNSAASQQNSAASQQNGAASQQNGNTTNNNTSSQNNAVTGNQIVKDENLNNTMTTYDEIMLQYVDDGVASSTNKEDIAYYKSLIDAYSADQISDEVKKTYTDEVSKLITKIDKQAKNYIELANATLSDYNTYKGTQYISYLSPVETKAALSRSTVTAFALAAGFCFGIILAVGIELFKKLKEQAEMQKRVENITLLDEGIVPVDTSKLSPIARKLFDQAVNHFSDFELHYQPITDSGGVYVGAEGLARWKDAELGMVMPSEFLPIAEKYDIMASLGEWILRKACVQCKQWNENGMPDFWVSINFSLSQISGPMFMDGIFKALNETHVDAKNIILEISNCGEIDNVEEVAKKFTALKTVGVRVSIDNFGEVASSVDSLSKLPVDLVKISRESVSNMMKNYGSLNFISNIVNMANLMGFKVCAEGVEEKTQADKLTELGVDYLQGYYFGRPMSNLQLEAKNNNKAAVTV